MDARLLAFADELRSEGVAIGTSELLDAFAVLGEIPWTDSVDFREGLATTLAKSQEDRRIFDLVFERFLFRQAEAEAVRRDVTERDAQDGSAGPDGEPQQGEIDIEQLRERIAEALRAGDEGAMRDLARLAIAAFGRQGEGSGVIGVDVQRIRRALGLRSTPRQGETPEERRFADLPRETLREFEALLRRELERDLIERTKQLPAARPLNELDRALPSGPLQDLAAVHRTVAQLKRRLATQGREQRGSQRGAHVDVRRTMRASLQTGGVPVVLKYRPQTPAPPRDLRALRRVDERLLGVGLLPLRAPCAA